MDHYGEPARVNWLILWRKAKFASVGIRIVAMPNSSLSAENHKAEEMANSKVGSQTNTAIPFSGKAVSE